MITTLDLEAPTGAPVLRKNDSFSSPPPLPLPTLPPFKAWKIDESKFTWGEWWRQMRSPLVVIGWGAKLFGIRLVGDVRVFRVRDWQALEISEAQLTEAEQAKLRGKLDAFAALGFSAPIFVRMENLLSGTQAIGATMRHANGRTLGRVSLCGPLPGRAGQEKLVSGFLTMFADGRYVDTDVRRPAFVQPPQAITEIAAGSLENMLRRHETRVEKEGAPIRPVRTPDEARAVIADFEEVNFAFQSQRGLYVPLTEMDAAQDVARLANAGTDSVLSATLDEVRRQHSSGGGWVSGLVILALSLLVSWNSYAGGGSLAKAALIVGILFFHELGHYLAMRLFKYRDVRMFFIPFLGAAVSGRHFNVSGSRKAIVSLMGPLPGIVAGTALAAYAIHAGSDALADAASLVVFINALNLLPILPLDGGCFWHSVLFCRHRALEVGFKVLAGLACIAASAGGVGKFLLYLGIVMLLSARSTWRQGKIAARLLREGCPPLSEDDDTIPNATATRIIQAVRETDKVKAAVPKALATETLAIFQRLNARPPNLLESFGLIAVYVVSLVIALGGFSLSYVFAHGLEPEGPKSSLVKLAAPIKPAHVPQLASEFHGKTQSTAEAGDSLTVLQNHFASFASDEAAARAFAEIRPELKKLENVTQFGAWLIQGHSPQDGKRSQAVAAALTARGGTVLSSNPRGPRPALDVRFTLPDAESAARVQHDLDVYGRVVAGHPVPAPWRLDPVRQEAVTRAGATYLRIIAEVRRVGEAPESQRANRQNVVRNLFNPAKGHAETWMKETLEKRRIANATVQQWLAGGAADLDPEVLRLWLEQPAIGTIDNGKWSTKFAHAIARSEAGDNEVPVELYECTAKVEGTQVTLSQAALLDPHFSLPALARYLTALGGTDIRFSFYLDESGPDADDDE